MSKQNKLAGWPEAVRGSGLRGPKQAVLLAMFTYIDWDSGECWASVPNIARSAGVCEQSARRAIEHLQQVGIIERTEPTPYANRKSNTHWLSLSELRRRARNPEDEGGGPVPDRGVPSGPTPVPDRPAPPYAVEPPLYPVDQPPVRSRGKHNNHPSIEHPSEHKSGASPVNDGMDGSDKPLDANNRQAVKNALREYGITEPNLTRFAAEPTITLALVVSNGERLRGDESIDDPAAALAGFLDRLPGINRGSKRISRADIDRTDRANIARIEKMSRQQQRNREAS